MSERECTQCNGTGSWPPPTRQVCPKCGGNRFEPSHGDKAPEVEERVEHGFITAELVKEGLGRVLTVVITDDGEPTWEGDVPVTLKYVKGGS